MSGDYASYEKVKQFVEEEMRKKENSKIPLTPNLEKMLEDSGYRYEVRHGKRYLVYAPGKTPNIVRRMDEKIHNLEQVSGKSIDQLICLFAAGWTLNPPREFTSFREFLDSL